jgi:hypothetical protein
VASFVALRFFEGLGVWEKWTTFLGGWALAAWGGPPLAAYLELKPSIEIGIVLLMGLFGMAIAAEAVRLIRDTDWRGLPRLDPAPQERLAIRGARGGARRHFHSREKSQ